MNIAQSFVTRLAQREEDANYRKWKRELPTYFFETIGDRVFEIVSQAGYTFSCNASTFKKRLEEYCWCCMKAYKKGGVLSFGSCANLEADDDYDWFRHLVGVDSFESIFDTYFQIGVFDKSPTGQLMRDYFLDFLWAQILIESSKATSYVRAKRDLYEDDEWITDVQINENLDS